MAADFYLVEGNRAPSLRAVLVDSKHRPVSLAGKLVFFEFRIEDDSLPLRVAPAVIEDATKAIARYDWLPGDSVAGTYKFRFKTDNAGIFEHFPSKGWKTLIVEKPL
ncbi:phage baseplate upper protein [Candidatus Parcubacteria bacterium]|nr:phage baseplate upper protein [Candidatus Parcubacteria bacterium]